MIATSVQRPKVLEPVIKAINATIGSLEAEFGGVIGQNRSTGIIEQFHFDSTADRTGGTYSPSLEALSAVNDAWHARGLRLCGFVHSHPARMTRPSRGDHFYAHRLLKANPRLPALQMPIVQTVPDTGKFSIHWYQALPNLDDVRVEAIKPILLADNRLEDDEELSDHPRIPRIFLPADTVLSDGTFDRVHNAYDLTRLSLSRMLVIGCGGAVGFVEDMARAGLRDFVLIDPDTVSVTNIATQHYNRSDIDRPKVEALKQRILDINPSAHVIALQNRLDDLSDFHLRDLATYSVALWKHLPTTLSRGPSSVAAQVDVKVRPITTLICGMTDNFHAQARASRLALHLGLPYIAAQVYPQGMAAEIVFFHPDGPHTACPRCILEPRYRAYLDEGFQNEVGSEGTPLATTSHLNAMKCQIALALLHHGSDHPRWGDLLEKIGPNNLVQIRLHPDCELSPFKKLTEAKPTTVRFGEPLFFPRKPNPNCPDCGGNGNLRRAIGRFSNTRILAEQRV